MILSKIVFSVEARHRVSPAGARRHRSLAIAYHFLVKRMGLFLLFYSLDDILLEI